MCCPGCLGRQQYRPIYPHLGQLPAVQDSLARQKVPPLHCEREGMVQEGKHICKDLLQASVNDNKRFTSLASPPVATPRTATSRITGTPIAINHVTAPRARPEQRNPA